MAEGFNKYFCFMHYVTCMSTHSSHFQRGASGTWGCGIRVVLGLLLRGALQKVQLLGQHAGDLLLPQDVGAQQRADAPLHFLSPFMGHNFFGPSLDVLPALLELFEIPQGHARLRVVFVGKRLPGPLLEGDSSGIAFLTLQHIFVLFYQSKQDALFQL